MLVEEILNNNESAIAPQLKGFGVGDGCVGTHVLCSFDGLTGPGPWYDLQFKAGHNMIPEDLY